MRLNNIEGRKVTKNKQSNCILVTEQSISRFRNKPSNKIGVISYCLNYLQSFSYITLIKYILIRPSNSRMAILRMEVVTFSANFAVNAPPYVK